MALLVAQHGPANDALDTLLYRQIAVDSGQPQSEWRGGGSTGEQGTRAEPLVQATGNWVTSPLGRIQSHAALQAVEGLHTVAIAARDLNSATGALQVSVQAGGGAPMPAVYNPTTGMYEATWDTTAHPDDDVILSATVTDDEGYTRSMPSLTVEVDNTDEVVEVVTYTSTDVPKTIPDRSTIRSTLTVPDSFSIYDLDVQLNITHTYVYDLSVRLIGPDGTDVWLFRGAGGSGDNFSGTILDDEAATSIFDGEAPYTGRYRPEELLRDFDDRNASGVWTLEVVDRNRKDTGTLHGWSIHFTREVAPAAPLAMSLESPTAADPAGNSSTLQLDSATVDRLLAESDNTWTRKSRTKLFV
jgi:subtilisin-like proprotein convertase family protein